MKREIQVFDYANEILAAVGHGILLTTKYKDKINTMTIGWGTLGIEWRKKIFTVFVRGNRFTQGLIEKSGEFTINVPYGDSFDKNIITYCGMHSGADTDKIKEMNLTIEAPQKISTPGIKEFPLTLECKVIYKQAQDKNAIKIDEASKKLFYPQEVNDPLQAANKYFHTAYYGEIVSAYIIE